MVEIYLYEMASNTYECSRMKTAFASAGRTKRNKKILSYRVVEIVVNLYWQKYEIMTENFAQLFIVNFQSVLNSKIMASNKRNGTHIHKYIHLTIPATIYKLLDIQINQVKPFDNR